MDNPGISPIIQVQNLCKAYGSVQAVNNVSFQVNANEIFGFLGPNGAGKTTTLSILEGLHDPDSGWVKIFGSVMTTVAYDIKRRIGVQLQRTSLMDEFSLLEQTMLFARLYGRDLSRLDALDLLEQVHLDDKANSRPRQLSGGEKQRFALMLALVNRPELIFLDEPTSGLDPQSRRMLWDMIRQCQASGMTIVLTTHYMEEAEALCQQVAIIDRGKLIALDSPAALISSVKGITSISLTSPLDIQGLQDLPGVAAVSTVKDRLQLNTEDITSTLEALLALARARRIRLGDMLIKQPSLEDVFLQLTGYSIRTD